MKKGRTFIFCKDFHQVDKQEHLFFSFFKSSSLTFFSLKVTITENQPLYSWQGGNTLAHAFCSNTQTHKEE